VWTSPDILVRLGLLVAGVLGLALAVVGFRGVRVHDRATCRRCRFDLSGSPGATVCPECGRDLSLRGAVVAGLRRRSRWKIALGLLLLLTTAGGFGFWYASRSNVKLNTFKPAWMLAMEARSQDTARASAALDELVLRSGNAKLSAGIEQELIDEALRQQAPETLLWLPQWADLVVQARQAGRLEDAKWKTFLRAGVKFELLIKPKMRRGQQASFAYRTSGPRLGNTTIYCRIEMPELVVGPQKFETHAGSWSGMAISGAGLSISSTLRTIEAPEGVHPVRMVLRVQIFDNPAASFGDSGAEAVPVDVIDVPLSGEVEIVAPDALLVTPIRATPESVGAMQRAIVIKELSVTPDPREPQGSVTIDANAVPYNAAFDVLWRWRDSSGAFREVVVCSTAFPAGSGGHSFSGGGSVKGFDAQRTPKVDVVLRGRAQVAENSTSIESFWDGELVFPDVPVNVDKPGASDTTPGAAGGPSAGGGG